MGEITLTEEIWKNFKCLNCGGILEIETTIPYMGWRCKHCKFTHMFKKQAKLECDTLEEIDTHT